MHVYAMKLEVVDRDCLEIMFTNYASFCTTSMPEQKYGLYQYVSMSVTLIMNQLLKLPLNFFRYSSDHQPETMTEEHNGKATIKLPILFLLPLLSRIVVTRV